MKALLLDDEILVLNNLKFLLKNFSQIDIVYESTSAAEVVSWIKENEADVLFIDISMPDINGIDLAEYASGIRPKLKIVFITAYDNYALEAFRANTVDYLLKPITLPKLTKTIKKLENYMGDYRSDIIRKSESQKLTPKIQGYVEDKCYIISSREGIFIKAEPRRIVLVSAKGEYLLKNPMTYWEELLKRHQWFRCHRGYLINLDKVVSTYPLFNQTYGVQMQGSKEEVIVSRSYIPEFKRLFSL